MTRILILDDDYLVRDMLERLMRRARYDVETAEDGAQALRLHRRHPVDLVITGILTPGEEGLGTLAEFRRSDPAVKIIAISGGRRIGPLNGMRAAALSGADRTFAKPVDTALLLAAVEELSAPPHLRSISSFENTPALQGR